MWSKFLAQQKIIKLIVEGLSETANCMIKLCERRSGFNSVGYEDVQHLKETIKKINIAMEKNDNGTV